MDALTLDTRERSSAVAEILNRIRGVLPEVASRRREIEDGRRLPRDLVDLLANTGMFRLGVPRALGGEEASPTELLTAIETVAAADGSAGWCAMIGIANGVSAGYLKDAGAREMFANPSAPTAGIAAPSGGAVRVEGGVEVTGRWSFASGITHVDWLWAGALVMENGAPRMTPNGPEIIYLCMPVQDVQVDDTWYVSGLSGTGSNDFVATRVFIPERRIFDLVDVSTHRPEPLYQMPALAYFAAQLAAVSLGIGRAAIDELVEISQTKVPTLHRGPLADKSAAQVAVARAEASLLSARLLLHESVRDIFDTLGKERAPTIRQIAMCRIGAMLATETAAGIARDMNILSGGSAIYRRSDLQRHARDAEVVLHHFTVAPHNWEEAGRVFLGRQPTVPVF